MCLCCCLCCILIGALALLWGGVCVLRLSRLWCVPGQCGALRWAAGSLPPHRPGGNVTPLVLGTPTMGAAAAGTVTVGGGADPGCGGAWRGRPPPPTQHPARVRRRPRHTTPPPRRASRVVQAAAAPVAAARRLLPARQQHAAGRHGPSTPPPPPLQMALVPRGPGRRLAGPLCRAWPAWLCFYGAAAGCSFPRPDFLFPKVVNHGGMR